MKQRYPLGFAGWRSFCCPKAQGDGGGAEQSKENLASSIWPQIINKGGYRAILASRSVGVVSTWFSPPINVHLCSCPSSKDNPTVYPK